MESVNNTVAVVGMGQMPDSVVATAVAMLNQAQGYFTFQVLPDEIALPEPDLERRHSLELLRDILERTKDIQGVPRLIGVMNEPVERNLFSHAWSEKGVGLITADSWPLVSRLPVEMFVATDLTHTLASLLVPQWRHHEDTRACIGDYCRVKRDINWSILSGKICEECRESLSSMPQEAYQAVEQICAALQNNAIEWIASP